MDSMGEKIHWNVRPRSLVQQLSEHLKMTSYRWKQVLKICSCLVCVIIFTFDMLKIPSMVPLGVRIME